MGKESQQYTRDNKLQTLKSKVTHGVIDERNCPKSNSDNTIPASCAIGHLSLLFRTIAPAKATSWATDTQSTCCCVRSQTISSHAISFEYWIFTNKHGVREENTARDSPNTTTVCAFKTQDSVSVSIWEYLCATFRIWEQITDLSNESTDHVHKTIRSLIQLTKSMIWNG